MNFAFSNRAITRMQAIIVTAIIVIAAIGVAYLATRSPPEEPTTRSLTFSSIALPYIDPAVGSDDAAAYSFVWLYDSLVYPTVTGGIEPALATSWNASEDALTWTFHLRQGAKFHDGSEVTAEDVKFSMDRLTTMGQGFAYLFTPYVESTSVVDDYTVEFKLKQALGPFLTVLVRLYVINKDLAMQHIETPGSYGDLGDYASTWILGGGDVGSGPYKVKDFVLESHMTVERFTDHWSDFVENAPDQVRYEINAQAATVQTKFAAREIDIEDGLQTEETYAAILNQVSGTNVTTFNTGNQEFYLMIHNRKPPTDDIHFRKAMAWAMDYETVVDDIYPGSVVSKGPVPANLPGHNPDVIQYNQNLTEAMEELALSKYADNYTQYTVEIHWVAEAPDYEKIANLFASCMAQIGINVQVVKVPWLTVVDELADIDTSPHILTAYVTASYAEAGSLLMARYHSDSTGTWEQCEWLQNSTIDAMIVDALTTVNRTERFEKYYAIQEQLMILCPSIFLFDFQSKVCYQAHYIDLPAARGEVNPVMGYIYDMRFISVDLDKKEQLT